MKTAFHIIKEKDMGKKLTPTKKHCCYECKFEDGYPSSNEIEINGKKVIVFEDVVFCCKHGSILPCKHCGKEDREMVCPDFGAIKTEKDYNAYCQATADRHKAGLKDDTLKLDSDGVIEWSPFVVK
jgi:hypothetical protein